MKRIVLAGFLTLVALSAQAADFTINSKTAKTVPVGTDLLLAADSEASFALKKITLNDLKTYIGVGTGTIPNGDTLGQMLEWNGIAWGVITPVDVTAGTGIDIAAGVISVTPTLTGMAYPVATSTTTGTGNINIDGASADHYYFNNGATAATYTPVLTSRPASGERGVILTVGGGAGVITMTWTNVSFMGTAGAAATTTNKYSHYSCLIPASGNAKCSIIAEASDY